MPIAELGRKTLLEIEVKERVKPDQLKLLRGLYNLGNNMNQITRKLNQNYDLSKEELEELNECTNIMKQIPNGFK